MVGTFLMYKMIQTGLVKAVSEDLDRSDMISVVEMKFQVKPCLEHCKDCLVSEINCRRT